ncbi:threonine synthase [Anaerosinus gibii]|uniref:Threonine synthase n=1 Tax=Selenobaculum gibii TaxID=3054208 RepID=A0A9Y2AK77_9FIRM|nr:threonine synthase [Selenobaculum gbiensis]WIW71651.1 threonine synthase [Selenobaculum gbiensis]
MRYISTRGNEKELTAAGAIIAGIADDGGLFVPNHIPVLENNFIESLINLSYQNRAKKILAEFLTDYTEAEVSACVERAYGNQKFDIDLIAPVVNLSEDTNVLELWHGPTSAFKDMALQLLPQLMSTALKKTGEKAEIIILVATSGDTGKAALEGFKDVDQIRIMVFYPQEGVSQMQRLQMVSQKGNNVSVIAVHGNFDDAQTGVKNIFNDEEFNKNLNEAGFQLSSANSINWGRLVPQIVYYFSAYADLVKENKLKMGDKVNFVVPTGNFGNILAGYYAKRMGLPVHKLICASNANNVLTDFLQTGTYNRNRAFHKTASPSMDILISSNLERLLFHIGGGDKVQVKAWMESLNKNGEYTVGADYLAKIKEVFWADWADDTKTAGKIKSVYEKHQYVADTHTAVAWEVADRYKKVTGDTTVNVIVSTASPYKFNASVLAALDKSKVTEGNEFAMLDALEKISGMKVPEGLDSLRTIKILHKQQCEKEDMKKVVMSLVK